ncbi:MAG TPA: hypothetical protein PLC26_05295 [Bacillota bacterium]|nr:hypothetical protein [Bacillota bacterium]
MVVLIWSGVALFAIVLTYAEVVFAKATMRMAALEGEGNLQIESHHFREKAFLQLLLGLSFFFCVLLDILLAYSLCRGG